MSNRRHEYFDDYQFDQDPRSTGVSFNKGNIETAYRQFKCNQPIFIFSAGLNGVDSTTAALLAEESNTARWRLHREHATQRSTQVARAQPAVYRHREHEIAQTPESEDDIQELGEIEETHIHDHEVEEDVILAINAVGERDPHSLVTGGERPEDSREYGEYVQEAIEDDHGGEELEHESTIPQEGFEDVEREIHADYHGMQGKMAADEPEEQMVSSEAAVRPGQLARRKVKRKRPANWEIAETVEDMAQPASTTGQADGPPSKVQHVPGNVEVAVQAPQEGAVDAEHRPPQQRRRKEKKAKNRSGQVPLEMGTAPPAAEIEALATPHALQLGGHGESSGAAAPAGIAQTSYNRQMHVPDTFEGSTQVELSAVAPSHHAPQAVTSSYLPTPTKFGDELDVVEGIDIGDHGPALHDQPRAQPGLLTPDESDDQSRHEQRAPGDAGLNAADGTEPSELQQAPDAVEAAVGKDHTCNATRDEEHVPTPGDEAVQADESLDRRPSARDYLAQLQFQTFGFTAVNSSMPFPSTATREQVDDIESSTEAVKPAAKAKTHKVKTVATKKNKVVNRVMVSTGVADDVKACTDCGLVQGISKGWRLGPDGERSLCVKCGKRFYDRNRRMKMPAAQNKQKKGPVSALASFDDAAVGILSPRRPKQRQRTVQPVSKLQFPASTPGLSRSTRTTSPSLTPGKSLSFGQSPHQDVLRQCFGSPGYILGTAKRMNKLHHLLDKAFEDLVHDRLNLGSALTPRAKTSKMLGNVDVNRAMPTPIDFVKKRKARRMDNFDTPEDKQKRPPTSGSMDKQVKSMMVEAVPVKVVLHEEPVELPPIVQGEHIVVHATPVQVSASTDQNAAHAIAPLFVASARQSASKNSASHSPERRASGKPHVNTSSHSSTPADQEESTLKPAHHESPVATQALFADAGDFLSSPEADETVCKTPADLMPPPRASTKKSKGARSSSAALPSSGSRRSTTPHSVLGQDAPPADTQAMINGFELEYSPSDGGQQSTRISSTKPASDRCAHFAATPLASRGLHSNVSPPATETRSVLKRHTPFSSNIFGGNTPGRSDRPLRMSEIADMSSQVAASQLESFENTQNPYDFNELADRTMDFMDTSLLGQ